MSAPDTTQPLVLGSIASDPDAGCGTCTRDSLQFGLPVAWPIVDQPARIGWLACGQREHRNRSVRGIWTSGTWFYGLAWHRSDMGDGKRVSVQKASHTPPQTLRPKSRL